MAFSLGVVVHIVECGVCANLEVHDALLLEVAHLPHHLHSFVNEAIADFQLKVVGIVAQGVLVGAKHV